MLLCVIELPLMHSKQLEIIFTFQHEREPKLDFT